MARGCELARPVGPGLQRAALGPCPTGAAVAGGSKWQQPAAHPSPPSQDPRPPGAPAAPPCTPRPAARTSGCSSPAAPPQSHQTGSARPCPGAPGWPEGWRTAAGWLLAKPAGGVRWGGWVGWGGELRGRAAHRGLLFGEGPLSVLPECSPAHHTPPVMLQLAPGRAAPHTRRAGPRGAQRAQRAPAGRRAAPARQPRGPPCCMPRLHQREAGRIHGSPPASEAQCTGSGGGLRPRGGAR